MSSLETLEQSVLNTLLVARPGESITEEISDWEPVAHPVPDTTLDGRLMEGTTYLEHSVLGVSLDSGLMAGMSSLEPLEQSVLNTLLVARPDEGITEEISDWEPVAHPVPDTNLDGRPMEGTTYLEHSALGCLWTVDSWRGCRVWNHSSSRFLVRCWSHDLLKYSRRWTRQSVRLWHRNWTTDNRIWNYRRGRCWILNQAGNLELDTDPSEQLAPTTHVDFGLLQLDARSCPLVNVALGHRPMEGITDSLPVESSGLVLAPDSGHVEYLPSPRPFEHWVLDMNMRYDNLDSSDELQFGSDSRQSSLELVTPSDMRYRRVGRWVVCQPMM